MKKKIIILDDDILPKFADFPDDEFFKIISDEDSQEFVATSDYLKENNLIDLGTSDIEDIIEFIQSSNFIEDVLCCADYQKIFKDDSGKLLHQLILRVEKHNKVFLPFITCFNNKEKFIVEKKNVRPTNSRELLGYDIVIMDLFMGDDFDNDFEGLAKYIGELYDKDNNPGVFLISSRDELEEQKKLFRKEAKISSLNFSILNKGTDLNSDTSLTQVQLAYAQMCRAEIESRVIRELSLSLEEAIASSTNILLEKLWTLDYPYLHQMYSCTTTENIPFTEYLLSILASKLQFNLESHEELKLKINNLEKQLEKNTEKHCSFSKESPNAMHDFEASTYFLGNSIDDIKFDHDTINYLSINNDKIPYKVPFGLLLLKKYDCNSSDSFIEGNEVLLNCTQQCDLSRNMIKQEINLIFIQGFLSKSPSNKHYSIPLPTELDKEKRRWWVNIDEKKIVAKPFYEFLRYFACRGYNPVAIARGSVVRQIRAHAFHNMSRTEAAVKAGHNNLFTVKLVTYNKVKNQIFEYQDTSDQAKPVLLYGFPDGSNDKTYHLLDQEHVEVINWIFSKSELVKEKLSQEDLENVMRNQLPKLNKKAQEKFGVKFSVTTSQEDTNSIVSDQYPVAIQFTML